MNDESIEYKKKHSNMFPEEFVEQYSAFSVYLGRTGGIIAFM